MRESPCIASILATTATLYINSVLTPQVAEKDANIHRTCHFVHLIEGTYFITPFGELSYVTQIRSHFVPIPRGPSTHTFPRLLHHQSYYLFYSKSLTISQTISNCMNQCRPNHLLDQNGQPNLQCEPLSIRNIFLTITL